MDTAFLPCLLEAADCTGELGRPSQPCLSSLAACPPACGLRLQGLPPLSAPLRVITRVSSSHSCLTACASYLAYYPAT